MNVAMIPDRAAPKQPQPEIDGNAFAASSEQALKQSRQAGGSDAETLEILTPQPLIPIDFSDDEEAELDLTPSAVVLGVTQGRVLQELAQSTAGSPLPPGGAAFGIVPIGGDIPDDLAAFLAQPVMQHKMSLGPIGDLRVSVGAVATVRPESPMADSTVEAGIGATFAPPPITTPSGQEIGFLGFLNFRRAGENQPELTMDEVVNGDEIQLPEGMYSVNFGVAFSVLGASAAALESLGQLLAMVPKPAIAAAGHSMLKLQQALNGVQNVADLKAGLGWRLTAEVDAEGEMIFKLGGQVVDPMKLVEDALSASGLPELPLLDNPSNDPSVANVNDAIHVINGGNAFDRARERNGRSDVPAVRLATDASDVVRAAGATLYPFLTEWAQSLTAHGPQSIEDVTRFLGEIWNNPATPPEMRNHIANVLANPYGFNFGIPAIEALNQLTIPPEDYGFVRSVFEGHYRDPVDRRQSFEQTMPQ